jgi:hypothetical protein
LKSGDLNKLLSEPGKEDLIFWRDLFNFGIRIFDFGFKNLTDRFKGLPEKGLFREG